MKISVYPWLVAIVLFLWDAQLQSSYMINKFDLVQDAYFIPLLNLMHPPFLHYFKIFIESWPSIIHWHDNKRRTFLWHAADEEKITAVHYLLERGAYIDIPDCKGVTPLMLAFSSKNNELIALFKAFNNTERV